jgi:tetratricopeptide (TPR) repeat protein
MERVMRVLVLVAAWACVCGSTATLTAQYYYFPAPYGRALPLAYRYGAPYGFGSPYVYDVWPYYLDTGAGPLGPYVAPPLYVPAEQLGFGPQAVRRFMGLDPVAPPIVNQNIIIAPRAGDPGHRANRALADQGNARVPAANPRLRESNAESRDRARQFIEFGDTQFRARNLAGAYDRYKKAAEAAPDLAEAWFRQGHALADLGRYDQASAAFRRGLGLRPEWPASGFQLADLYTDNRAAHAAMLEALKRSLDAQPDDVNVQYAAAVQFFFDGRAEQARTALKRARELGEAASNIDPYLRRALEELDI